MSDANSLAAMVRRIQIWNLWKRRRAELMTTASPEALWSTVPTGTKLAHQIGMGMHCRRVLAVLAKAEA